jgi:hypothetical protein
MSRLERGSSQNANVLKQREARERKQNARRNGRARRKKLN